MPPPLKGKGGKGADKDKDASEAKDYTRLPLPAVSLPGGSPDQRPCPRAKRVLGVEHSFPEEWTEEAAQEEAWGFTGETLFEDTAFALPESIEVLKWVRAPERVTQPPPMEEVADPKGKKDAKKKDAKKGKGAPGLAIEERDMDDNGALLPRVVVNSTWQADHEVSDEVKEKPQRELLRGFQRYFTAEQLTSINSGDGAAGEGLREEKANELDGEAASGIGNQGEPESTSPQAEDAEESSKTEPPIPAPAGEEVGRAMTSVFKAIAEFQATATSSSGCGSGTVPFLWEAIYPQDATGRPCFNPGGSDLPHPFPFADHLHLHETKRCVALPTALAPTILMYMNARYVVKLWGAGRWRKVLVDDRVPLGPGDVPAICSSEDPREIWPILLGKALLKMYSLGMLDGMDTPGSAFVSFCMYSLTGWLPTSTAALSKSLQEASIGDSFSEMLAAGTPALKQAAFMLPNLEKEDPERLAKLRLEEEKRQKAALFLHKKRKKKKVKSRVFSKEEIDEVSMARGEAMRSISEAVGNAQRDAVWLLIKEQHVMPVLAVCEGKDDEPNKLLVKWELPEESEPTVVAPDVPACPGEESTGDPEMTAEAIKFPEPLNEWYTLAQLEEHGASLIRFDTKSQLLHNLYLHYHWEKCSADEMSNEKEEGLDESNSEGRCSAGSVKVSYPGPPSPIYLSLSPSPPAPPAEAETGGEDGTANDGTDTEASTKEVLEARLVLVLTADRDLTSTSTSSSSKVPLLVLQSMDGEAEEEDQGIGSSMYHRMVYSKGSDLPFCISSTMVRFSRGKPRIFKLLLTAGVGCCIDILSTAPVNAGDASKVWSECGGHTVLEDGSYKAMPVNEWSVLFRRQLALPTLPLSEEEEHLDANEANSGKAADVWVMLHLLNALAKPFIRLVVLNNDTGELSHHALLHLPKLTLQPSSKGYTLIAIAHKRCGQLEAGSWRLMALSTSPLQQEGDKLPEEACGSRAAYSNYYIPNKRLCMIRDVLSCPSGTPVSIRFRMSEAAKGAWVLLRITDRATGALLREQRCHMVVEELSITMPEPSEADEEAAAAAAAPAKGKKASTIEPTAPVGKIIIEATIDEERCVVPEEWRSTLPHMFQPTPSDLMKVCEEGVDENDDGQPEQGRSFQWWLEVISSEPGILSHDDAKLNEEASVIQSWETAEEDVTSSGGDGEERASALKLDGARESARQQKRLKLKPCKEKVMPLEPALLTVLSAEDLEERHNQINQLEEGANLLIEEYRQTREEENELGKAELAQLHQYISDWRTEVEAALMVPLTAREEQVKGMVKRLEERKQAIAAWEEQEAEAAKAAAKGGKGKK